MKQEVKAESKEVVTQVMTPEVTQDISEPRIINGQIVVVLPDLVGPVPVSEQHEYVEIEKGSNVCASISIRESDLEVARTLYPGLPVYGLWQLFVANDAFASENEQLYTSARDEENGYYLYRESGRILHSGNYEAGFFAEDASLNLNIAHRLSLDFDGFELPKKQALLAREILKNKKETIQKNLLVNSALFVSVIFFGFLVDFYLQYSYEKSNIELSHKFTELRFLEGEYNKLHLDRIENPPEHKKDIEKIAELLQVFPDAETSQSKRKVNDFR